MAEISQSPDEKLDMKKVLPIFIIILIDLLGLTIIIPMLPHYAVSFGASPFTYGLLGAAYPVMQFLAAPLLGRLSDKYGRKPVLIISQIGTLVGFLVMGFADALWILFLARIIDGISGANISTAQAAITDSTTAKTRTQGLGLIGAAFGLGFIIGPMIAFAALGLTNNNFAVPAFLAAGFSYLSIMLTVFWFDETHPEEKRGESKKGSPFAFTAMAEALKRPKVGGLLILMFFQQFAFYGFELMIALFTLDRLGMMSSDNAALFVYIGIMVVAVQGYFVGKWSKKLGDHKLISIGLLALSIGLLLMFVVPEQPVVWYDEAKVRTILSAGESLESVSVNLPDEADRGWWGLGVLVLSMIPASIGGGILMPTINSLITKQVADDEVGAMLGVSTSVHSAANAIAPIMMGFFFQQFGSGYPFLIGGLMIGVLLVVSGRLIGSGDGTTTE